MKKFKIAIEETISQEFEIEADNAERSYGNCRKKYKSGEFVIEPGELTYKQMAITSPDDEVTEWTGF